MRAAYSFVTDMDFRHTSYWREQLEYCEQQFLASRRTPRSTESQLRVLLGRLVLAGFDKAQRRPYRGGVSIPGVQ